MKRIVLSFMLLSLGYFLPACNSTNLLKDGKPYQNFRGFEPTDPTEYDDRVSVVSGDSVCSKEMKLLKPGEILSFLNNETVLVSIGQVTAEGGIKYIPVTISTKNTSYKVTMDYMKFATLGQKDNDGSFIGFKRVGVGLRLISLITTAEAGINIGDLSSIGLAAKAGKLNGTLMIEVVGIKSKEVTTLLPLPSEINQTTIQNAMQALATIKSKIYDEDTKLYPQVMAVKTNDIPNKVTTEIQKEKLEADSIIVDKKIRLQLENNRTVSVYKEEIAKNMEEEAFQSIFKRDVAQAIEKFEAVELAYPGYHSAYEIKNILKRDQSRLSASNTAAWKSLYTDILKNYSYKLPAGIMTQLRESGQ